MLKILLVVAVIAFVVYSLVRLVGARDASAAERHDRG